jgi:hypothetical protein
MKIRRTNDPDICFAAADAVALWCYGITGYRIDKRNGKFLMTPSIRDGGEGPILDAADMCDRFRREQER